MSTTATSRRGGSRKTKPNLNLLRARMSKGLSRKDLADLAGITEKQVGVIERGEARRSYPDTLLGLATALEEDVLTLFPIEGRLR